MVCNVVLIGDDGVVGGDGDDGEGCAGVAVDMDTLRTGAAVHGVRDGVMDDLWIRAVAW